MAMSRDAMEAQHGLGTLGSVGLAGCLNSCRSSLESLRRRARHHVIAVNHA